MNVRTRGTAEVFLRDGEAMTNKHRALQTREGGQGGGWRTVSSDLLEDMILFGFQNLISGYLLCHKRSTHPVNTHMVCREEIQVKYLNSYREIQNMRPVQNSQLALSKCLALIMPSARISHSPIKRAFPA